MKNFNTKLLLFAAFLSIILMSCQNPITADLNKEFDLKINHEVLIKSENLKIKFLSISEESRCPADVVCFWEGNAGVVLKVQKDSASVTDTLNTFPQFQTLITFLQYKITLKKLVPYPVSTQPIDTLKYKATLLVTKEVDGREIELASSSL